MRFIFLFIFFLMFASSSEAQSNLVLNPSFELHHDTVDGIGAFYRNYVTDWSDPNQGSSDLFVPNTIPAGTIPPSNAFGFEYPHIGLSYAGFLFYVDPTSLFHEYVQASFASSLIAGNTYGIETYVSSASEGQSLCISDLGFYFSDTQMHVDASPFGERIPVTPQFENPSTNMITTFRGWQRITGSYTAHGGEKYMSIGNFKPYSMAHIDTCGSFPGAIYLFIDDVAVYDTAKVDTFRLCANDSVQIGGLWRHSEGLYYDTISGLLVKFYLQSRSQSTNVTMLYRPFENGDSVRVSLIQAEGIDSIGLGFAPNFIYIKNDTTMDIQMFNIYGCDSTVRYVCGWHLDIWKQPETIIEWSISPNPSHDFIEIKLANNSSPTYQISILDITCKEIFTQSLQQNKIDVTTLNSGMYFVKLMNAKSTEVLGVKKFVKE